MAYERVQKSFGQSSSKKKHNPIVPPIVDHPTQADSQLSPKTNPYKIPSKEERDAIRRSLFEKWSNATQSSIEEELQMKSMMQLQAGDGGMAATAELESSIQQARGGGQPLADNIRKPMEQAFGADFSGVKVHTDAQADQLNQSIQAKAFTTGQDVFFREGAYEPNSRGGQELLAHELTHVVQQNGADLQPQLKQQVIQRKWDHLFNDIPKTLKDVPDSFKRPDLKSVSEELNALRDNSSNGQDNVHQGTDQNSTVFGHMSNSFRIAVEAYGRGDIDENALRQATYELWKNSIDEDVARSLGNKVATDIKAWNAQEKKIWEALGKHF